MYLWRQIISWYLFVKLANLILPARPSRRATLKKEELQEVTQIKGDVVMTPSKWDTPFYVLVMHVSNLLNSAFVQHYKCFI